MCCIQSFPVYSITPPLFQSRNKNMRRQRVLSERRVRSYASSKYKKTRFREVCIFSYFPTQQTPHLFCEVKIHVLCEDRNHGVIIHNVKL